MKIKLEHIVYLVFVFIFIVLTLDFYLSKKYYFPSADTFLSNPAKYDGKQTEFAGPVINVSKDSFYMSVNHRPIKIYYSKLENPKLGQIYIKAKLNKDGTANALDSHNLSYNYLKYAISFFGLIIFIIIFFREWRLKKWRLVENA